MLDLNDLIPAGSDWVFAGAQSVNDAGEIVGWGRHGGAYRGFLLEPAAVLRAQVDVKPDTLLLHSKGSYVTCYVELTKSEVTVRDIDPTSLKLQGSIPTLGPSAVGDYDRDSLPDLMAKFSRDALCETLSPGMQTITLTGALKDGIGPMSEDIIRVTTRVR